MEFLDKWLRLAERLSALAIRGGGMLVLASAFLVALEVLARKLFLVSFGGADELSGYAFAIGTSWALAFTLLQRGNVRVDALYVRLPARLQALLDLAGLLALTCFLALLGWQALDVLETSIAFDARATTPMQTPLWIPQAMWLAGFVLFLFAIAPLFLRTLLALGADDLATVRRLAGARSIEEEAASETGATRS